MTVTLAGSRSMWPARSAIAAGMVAEKNSVCRCFGQLGDDLPDVVDEAHVEHAVGLVEHQHLDGVEPQRVRCTRSRRRPGVATSTSTPPRSARTCAPIDTPPIATATPTRRCLP